MKNKKENYVIKVMNYKEGYKIKLFWCGEVIAEISSKLLDTDYFINNLDEMIDRIDRHMNLINTMIAQSEVEEFELLLPPECCGS